MNFNNIIANLTPISLTKGDNLFHQNDEVTGIYYLENGVLNISQKNEDNQIIFQRFVFEGDTVGHRSLFIHKKYSGSASVLSDSSKVYFLPTAFVLEQLATNIEFSRFIISKIASELQRAEEDRSNFKRKMAIEQLAIILIDFANKHSSLLDNGTYLLKSEISKKCLAQSLLMADETVIRLMTELKNEKIIDYIDKKINILNLSKLRDIANLN